MVEYLEPNIQYNDEVVVLGGGTGIVNLLRGLKTLNNPEKITAIYTTWDSGGSTGYLRNEFGVLPKGDARRQFLALMPDERKMHILQELFESRLTLGGERHNFGNLMLMALDRIHDNHGMDAASQLFDVRSSIIGATLNPLTLCFKDQRGREFYGEHHLDDRSEQSDFDPNNRVNSIFFAETPKVNPLVTEKIKRAKKIVFPSGSKFGSIEPFKLVREIRDAILESDAELMSFESVMTEPGQTDGYSVLDGLKVFNRYMRNSNRLDYLFVHENHIPESVLDIYEQEGQNPIAIDDEIVKQCLEISPNLRIIRSQFASYFEDQHLIRHDPLKSAKVVLDPKSLLAA